MRVQAAANILKAAAEKLLKSLPEDLAEQFKKEAFITGGAIPSLLLDERVNDYDIYLQSETFVLQIRDYYNNLVKEREEGDLFDDIEIKDLGLGFRKVIYQDNDPWNFAVVFLSPNAITLHMDKQPKYQIMIGFMGTPKEITDSFDWAHIKSYFTFSDMKIHLNPNTHELIADKTLKYTGSEYPLSSMMRTRKYMARGWRLSAHQMTLLALDMQKHDLTNKKELIRQMSGMDPLYIAEELQKLSDTEMSLDDRINELQKIISEESGWDYIENN